MVTVAEYVGTGVEGDVLGEHVCSEGYRSKKRLGFWGDGSGAKSTCRSCRVQFLGSIPSTHTAGIS